MENPPLRVVLGKKAFEMVMGKLEREGEGYRRLEGLSFGTEVDG